MKRGYANSAAAAAIAFGAFWGLPNGEAAAQSVSGALPSREQVEIPRVDPPGPTTRLQVSDRMPAAAPCPFEQSAAQVDIRSLRFSGPEGAALPPMVVDVLSNIAPEPGLQPVSSLCRLRDQATERLRAAGYVAAVQIPPQEINNAEAVLQVTLARLVDVEVNGSPGPYGATLNGRIEQLKRLDPFNTREAERILLLAGDVPGLDVALALRPAGTAPGEVIGALAVRYVPWTIIGSINNHGSRFLGREAASARAEFYGLTGLSDRTFIGASSTFDLDEQQTVQVGHYFGDDDGNTFGGRFSYAWSRPDVGVLDLRSRSIIAGLDLATPLVRSVRETVVLGGGLELIEQRVRLDAAGGSLAVTRDKLRVAFARISGSVREPRFVGGDAYALGGSLELRQGLDIFGATEPGSISREGYTPSRMDGNAAATVLRGGLEGLVALGHAAGVAATVQGQWANEALLSFEEFSVGTLTIGRGYDPGVTSGDRAVGFRVEPRAQLPIGRRVGTELFAFYDQVTIWNLDRFATENDRTLRSWGAGIRGGIPGKVLVEAMYARPEDRALSFDTKRASDRFLISLTFQFHAE